MICFHNYYTIRYNFITKPNNTSFQKSVVNGESHILSCSSLNCFVDISVMIAFSYATILKRITSLLHHQIKNIVSAVFKMSFFAR